MPPRSTRPDRLPRALARLLWLALAALALLWWQQRSADAPETDGLPAQVAETRALIEDGGPFPYDRDGSVFQNREGRLPPQPRGYYREYTVPTPGSRDRGARRIVTGGDPPSVWYYTDDHYGSFRQLEERPR